MRPTARRALWIAGAVVLVGLTGVMWSTWTSMCIDYVNAPGVCVSEPAVGAPQSVVLTVLGLGGATACVWMAARGARSHRGDDS